MVVLESMERKQIKAASVICIAAERREERTPVIARRGEKRDIEIGKGQHNKRVGKREEENGNLWERKRWGTSV